MSQPRVFVSHSHKDDDFTERLVADLQKAGADAWMDKTDLGAGNFQQRISEALAGREWFVLVLTRDALASPWVRQEVDAANRLKNHGQIRDLIFLQAGPLEQQELPPMWGVFNIFDATVDYVSARNRVLKAMELAIISPDRLAERLIVLGLTPHIKNGLQYISPLACRIPAGPFLIGSEPKRDWRARDDEQPRHTVDLLAYDIARYPVTVLEYSGFVRAGHAAPNGWKTQRSTPDHPVVCVTWYDAVAYAAWLSDRMGERWRLPTEAEWEKAARGTDGRVYPWGDTFDTALCNSNESGIRAMMPVGSYPYGASPYGVQDMAGNAWEWTASRYLPYPYTMSGEREDVNSADDRVVRGGSWIRGAEDVRSAYREQAPPDHFRDKIGFRLVRSS